MKDKLNDIDRFNHILTHYYELIDELERIKATDDPVMKDLLWRKCVYMDLFQIGEHVNNLSVEIKTQLNSRDCRGIVDIRNTIGHGYVVTDPKKIMSTIDQDLPKLITRLKELF